MSPPKTPTLGVVSGAASKTPDGPQVLQPSGWPAPKGYANGMMADGRLVVTGGVIGWNSHGAGDGIAGSRQARDRAL